MNEDAPLFRKGGSRAKERPMSMSEMNRRLGEYLRSHQAAITPFNTPRRGWKHPGRRTAGG